MSDREIAVMWINGTFTTKHELECNVHIIFIFFDIGVVLACLGFTSNEKARMALAEVKMPPFTKGK